VLGWIFIALGALFFLAGITMAICILIAGRSLSRRKAYSFALVMACVECLFIPFGTILGAAAVLKDDAGTPPRLRETKQATGDFARSAVECDASSHRFSRLASPYSPQPGTKEQAMA
jgi:hypothetical protein